MLRILKAAANPFCSVTEPDVPLVTLKHCWKTVELPLVTIRPFSTTPTTCCAVGLLIGKIEPLLVAIDSVMFSGMPGAGTPRALAGARTLVILNVRVPPWVPGAMIGIPLNTRELGDPAPASWPCQTL